MKKIKLVVIALAAIITSSLIVGCKKDKDSKPIISVSPDPLYIYGKVGDLVTFRVDISSSVKLSKVYITGQPDNETPHMLLDTAISTKGTTFNFYYRLPSNLAGKSIVIDFKVEDSNGMTAEAVKRVYVEALPATQARVLVETSGHRMYSNLSVNPDAYNLETNTAEFSTVGDSTNRDIQDMSGTSSTLSKNWRSPAGGKFVFFSGFDYANATDSSAINAYNSGTQLSLLSNVQVGNVYITKLGSVSSNKYAVIRVTYINEDTGGKDGDYYEFTIKK